MADFYTEKVFIYNRLSTRLRLWIIGVSAILVLCPLHLSAQSIVDKLDKVSRSSINGYALNNKGVPIDTTRGFFISADGLAITTASLFSKGDTVIFTDEKDRPLQLNRIVAFHKYGNLALIQLRNPRTREIEFIQPSRKPFESLNEILAFTHNADADRGLGYGNIGNVVRIMFLGRCANISIQAGAASECAPIVNSSGDFIGLYYFNGSKSKAILLPVSLITDDHWTSVNQSWTAFKSNPLRNRLTNSLYAQALINQGMGN